MNASFFNYAHSIFTLMLWVLPINILVLVVWVHNLAVHWLTPFSSHHNVLSIMPFLILVETMTSGLMIPRIFSRLVSSGSPHKTTRILICVPVPNTLHTSFYCVLRATRQSMACPTLTSFTMWQTYLQHGSSLFTLYRVDFQFNASFAY